MPSHSIRSGAEVSRMVTPNAPPIENESSLSLARIREFPAVLNRRLLQTVRPELAVQPRVIIDLGYRYMDWGTSTVSLVDIFGGPAGKFTADITSHQVFLGIRYNSLATCFRVRSQLLFGMPLLEAFSSVNGLGNQMMKRQRFSLDRIARSVP